MWDVSDLVYKNFFEEPSQFKFYRQWPFKVASFCINLNRYFISTKSKTWKLTSTDLAHLPDLEELLMAKNSKCTYPFDLERNGVQTPYFNNYQTLICPSYISFILFLVFNWNSVLFFFLVIYTGSAQSVNIIKSMDLVLTSHNFDISRK